MRPCVVGEVSIWWRLRGDLVRLVRGAPFEVLEHLILSESRHPQIILPYAEDQTDETVSNFSVGVILSHSWHLIQGV